MNKFTLCGKTYDAVEFTLNTVCDFEDVGIDIESIDKNPMKSIRAFVSLSVGCDIREAGRLLNQHIVEGGNLDDISSAFQKSVEESDFFLAISKEA